MMTVGKNTYLEDGRMQGLQALPQPPATETESRMPEVQSSNISYLDYNPDLQELKINFRSGHAYTYQNVSEEEYQSLLNADSVGEALPSEYKKLKGCEMKIDISSDRLWVRITIG